MHYNVHLESIIQKSTGINKMQFQRERENLKGNEHGVNNAQTKKNLVQKRLLDLTYFIYLSLYSI